MCSNKKFSPKMNKPTNEQFKLGNSFVIQNLMGLAENVPAVKEIATSLIKQLLICEEDFCNGKAVTTKYSMLMIMVEELSNKYIVGFKEMAKVNGDYIAPQYRF